MTADKGHSVKPVIIRGLPIEVLDAGIEAWHDYNKESGWPPQIITDGQAAAVIRAALAAIEAEKAP